MQESCSLIDWFPSIFPQVKSFVYMMQCAANDEENQKLGIVGLLYHVGDQLNKPDPDLMSQGPATLDWVPIQWLAYLCEPYHVFDPSKTFIDWCWARDSM
jgi:hypothetical protein